jgi:protein-L-isoaspartate O-methyltransferase
MTILREIKRRLREHPLSRDVYRIAADRWARLSIGLVERLEGRYYTAARLDRMFIERPDPWSYQGDSSSERRKQLTLQALPKRRYGRMLEIGCAEGWMTQSLAEIADELVCVDISAVALERARRQCEHLPHVSFRRMDLVEATPSGSFDAIVCCGVLVLLPRDVQRRIRDDLVSALHPGGHLLIENQTDAHPGALAGAFVAALFRESPELGVVHDQRVDDYGITVFQRK